VTETHALLMNGDTWFYRPSIDKGVADDIGAMLHRMDGAKFYSLLLWKLPPSKSLDDVSPFEDANEYIQCAGMAERMTVEVRRLEGDKYEHFVVGRAPQSENPAQKETIHWEDVDTVVAPNEVFSADEAAELFLSYHRTGWVASSYVLRPLST
jgi:hypothetical protein